MPFTGSHPAAVLPLLRRGRWVSAALITGSVAPDLPSFVPLGLTHPQTHVMTAIGWPDSVLGFGLLLAWWAVLRPGLTPLLPASVRRRWGRPGWIAWRELRDPSAPSGPRPVGRWSGRVSWSCWLVISMFAGLATHLVWDSFTHYDGWTVLHWSALAVMVLHHQLYVWLQLLSSVFGLAIVGAWLIHDWRRTPPVPRGPGRVAAGRQLGRTVIVTVWSVLGVVAACCGVAWEREQEAAGLLAGHLDRIGAAIKGFGGGLLVGLALWSLCWLAVRRRARVAGPDHEWPAGEARTHSGSASRVP
jgi:hypothetical protein